MVSADEDNFKKYTPPQMTPNFISGRILNDSYTNNFSNLAKDYKEIVWALERVNYSLFEFRTPLKGFQDQLEVLVLKFVQINYTLAHLLNGTPMYDPRDRKTTVTAVDVSSIYVLLRAVIETYLTIFYLNFQVTEQHQANFRNLLYRYSGIGRRQSFPLTSKKAKSKLEFEKIQLQELRGHIEGNEYFKTLKKEKQIQLLTKYEAKEMSWTELINSRGIKSMKFLAVWKLLSNHAHAEYLGTIQFRDLLQAERDLSGTYSFASHAVMLVALLIDDYLKTWKPPVLIFDSFEEDLRIKIDVYRNTILEPLELDHDDK
jgi:hypothetical protein